MDINNERYNFAKEFLKEYKLKWKFIMQRDWAGSEYYIIIKKNFNTDLLYIYLLLDDDKNTYTEKEILSSDSFGLEIIGWLSDDINRLNDINISDEHINKIMELYVFEDLENEFDSDEVEKFTGFVNTVKSFKILQNNFKLLDEI